MGYRLILRAAFARDELPSQPFAVGVDAVAILWLGSATFRRLSFSSSFSDDSRHDGCGCERARGHYRVARSRDTWLAVGGAGRARHLAWSSAPVTADRRVVVAAEMVARRDGLGFASWMHGTAARTSSSEMIVIGVIGIAIDRALFGLTKIPGVRWGYER